MNDNARISLVARLQYSLQCLQAAHDQIALFRRSSLHRDYQGLRQQFRRLFSP